MDKLFSPIAINNLTLKNRIVMPALASFLIGRDGSISEATVEHYRRRAAGGPAMVIMEACAVSPEGKVSEHQAVIHHDRYIDGLSRLAREKADMVCIGRGLLADPEMPIKAQQGRLEEIRTCIACNTCMQSIFKKGRNGVHVADKTDQECFIEADRVIIATGTRPNARLFHEVKNLGVEVFRIGDCRQTRDAKEAIYESAVLARKI
jgi:2,4-dienoyl-CoA reductase-like NADH-dependent reductase (Old Yellow Enzyme family)